MVSYIKGFFNSILSYLGLFEKKANLIFLGLDNAGKSTLLHLLKYDRISQTPPTIQPKSEEFKIGNIRLNTFDLGGHLTARKIWKDYFPIVDGIVYIIDSSDVERFEESKQELESILEDENLANVPIALLANKIDKNKAASEEEIVAAFDLSNLVYKNDRKVELFMCSIIKKVGYSKVFEWLNLQLK